MNIYSVEDELSVGDEPCSLRSSSSCSWRFSDETCAASTAAAAFHTFRQLVAEVSALDDATCSIAEKLVKVAAKRRRVEDAFPSNHQQPWIIQQQRPQMAKQDERLETGSQPESQQLWHEQRLRQERELLALWSEATSQPEDTEKHNGSCNDVQIPPPGKNKKEERGGDYVDKNQGSPTAAAAAREREVTQLTPLAADIATQVDAMAHEEQLFFACLSTSWHSPVVANPNDREPPSAAVAADFETTIEKKELAGDTIPRVSAADETLVEIEKLLAALQKLLNRLYNVALRAQKLLDDLRYHLQPLLAQQTAAAARTMMATAEIASGLREKGEEKAATSATSAAAPKAAPIKRGQTNSATTEMSGEPEEGKGERKTRGAREREEYPEKKGERREEDEERQLCDACSTLSIGAQSGSDAAEMRKKLSYQQQRNSFMCKRSRDDHQPRVKERKQSPPYDQHAEPKKQQLFPQQLQQVSQPQPWPSEACQAWKQQQAEPSLLSAVTLCPTTSQKKQFLCEENHEEQVDDWKRVVVLLQLYEAIVRTIEGDWHFKQEVKEELRFEISFKVFLAARAAWFAKPFVSDLAPFLQEAASLAEECCNNRRQQQQARSKSDKCNKQYCYSAPPTATTSKA